MTNYLGLVEYWMPTILLAVIIFSLKNYLVNKIKFSVKHDFDEKIENLKASLLHKESQIEFIRSSVLQSLNSRDAVLIGRKVEAVEIIWDCVIKLESLKLVCSIVSVLKFDNALKESALNTKFRDVVATLGVEDNYTEDFRLARKQRPFISEYAWALFHAYETILIQSRIKYIMLKNGVQDGSDYIDWDKAASIIKLALPEHENFIEESKTDKLHYLLDVLERKLLVELRISLEGNVENERKATNAAAILNRISELGGDMQSHGA